MAITYWPKHDEDNTEAAFAQYTDKLFGFADHASSDTAFMALWTSNDGTYDTYTITAGSYMFDGYLFTAAGTETLVVDDGTSTDCYLSYIKVDATGVINECGVYTSAGRPTAGTGETRYDKLLWNFNARLITDYRQVFTWGKQSVASISAGCADFLSSQEGSGIGAASYDDTRSVKRFRCGYPGTVYLTFDAKAGGSTSIYTYHVRNGTGTVLYTDAVTTTYASFTHVEISGLQAGDFIDIQGASSLVTFYAKNFRIRYITSDIPIAAITLE